MFLRVLKQFRDNQGQYFEPQFQQAYRELNWRELKRLAHSLKGVSYTLGAIDLGESSVLLLNAIEENNQEHTLHAFDQVVTQLNWVISGLTMVEQILQDCVTIPERSGLNSDLERLVSMLKARDTAAVDFVHDLAHHFVEEPAHQIWSRLQIAIDRYDFKSAMKDVEQLNNLVKLKDIDIKP